MSMLNYSRDLTINGGLFNAVTESPIQIGIDKLVKAANPNAMHNSSTRYDPPKCHPGTREAILEYIMQWIFGHGDRDALILWLYGSAGAGKSAILQSVAEKCAALDILLASFLFSRSDETRNHPGSLVATIAYQIGTRIPQITTALDAAIVRDPIIFDKTLDAQIDLLIVGPLKDLVKSGFFADRKSSPRLILVDGLDECNNQNHRSGVLRAIARALRVHHLPLMFLVSSRPEPDIKVVFDSAELVDLWDSLVLDHTFMPSDDIRLFLNDSFRSIKETHPLKEHIPPIWPTTSAVNTLVTKSSGQFIYASTVIKSISTIHASPPRQLDIILGIRAAHSGDIPFAEIDALYTHILSSVRDTQLMLDVLAMLMGHFAFDGSNDMLKISQLLGVDEEDVGIVLASLASITTYLKFTNEDGVVYRLVYISHASLSDFLADRNRSGHFHINKIQRTARLRHHGIRWLCLQTEKSSNSCDPMDRSMLDFLRICEEIFILRPKSEITKDLSRDSMSAMSLDLIQGGMPLFQVATRWKTLEYLAAIIRIIMWTERKLPLVKTATNVDPRYQEICINYAKHLKPCLKDELNKIEGLEDFTALMETLGHDFMLNGTRYDEALTEVLIPWAGKRKIEILKYISEDSVPLTIYKAIELVPMNARQNPYIHTASQILKSLNNCPDHNIWLGFQGFKVNSSYYVNVGDFLGNPSWERIHISRYVQQCMWEVLRSGEMAKFRRELRLKKRQPGIHNRNGELRNMYDWNRDLVLKLLVPILDLCPKSDKLLALLNRRIRRACLKYTPLRRLRDAVCRYVRRTSEAGNK